MNNKTKNSDCGVICLACAGREFHDETTVRELAGSREVQCLVCISCGTVAFTETDSVEESYNSRDSNDFSSRKGPILMWLRNKYRVSLASSLTKRIKFNNCESIVDYGAGDGLFAVALKSTFKGATVLAVDVASERPGGLDTSIGYKTVDQFLESDSVFDLIVLRHVLEHIEDPVYCITQLGTKLSSRGKIYIEVPNANSIWRTLLGKFWAGYYWPYHLFVPSAQGLRSIAELSSLEVDGEYSDEVPIFGSSLMHTKLPYKVSVLLGMLLYPFQFIVSFFCKRSEAITVVLKLPD